MTNWKKELDDLLVLIAKELPGEVTLTENQVWLALHDFLLYSWEEHIISDFVENNEMAISKE